MSAAYTDDDWFAARNVILDGPFSGSSEAATKILDAVAPAIEARSEVKALRSAAEAAEAFSRDRGKKVLPRMALRVAANWLRARADGIERTP